MVQASTVDRHRVLKSPWHQAKVIDHQEHGDGDERRRQDEHEAVHRVVDMDLVVYEVQRYDDRLDRDGDPEDYDAERNSREARASPDDAVPRR